MTPAEGRVVGEGGGGDLSFRLFPRLIDGGNPRGARQVRDGGSMDLPFAGSISGGFPGGGSGSEAVASDGVVMGPRGGRRGGVALVVVLDLAGGEAATGVDGGVVLCIKIYGMCSPLSPLATAVGGAAAGSRQGVLVACLG
jgi:hypothetical protein